MDLAVAPLTDECFNNAKSELKYLEYSAVKLPSICSDLPPYNQVVRHKKTGLLTDNSAASWAEKIHYAIDNPGRMHDMAKHAYEEVVTEHLMKQQEDAFDKLLLESINKAIINSRYNQRI